MKISEPIKQTVSTIVNLISLLFLFLLALGNIVVIVIVFLLAPLSILTSIRKIFPVTGQEIVVKFFFSWYDLTLYIPGAVLAYFLIVKLVYPFSKFTFLHFVIEPFKDSIKK